MNKANSAILSDLLRDLNLHARSPLLRVGSPTETVAATAKKKPPLTYLGSYEDLSKRKKISKPHKGEENNSFLVALRKAKQSDVAKVVEVLVWCLTEEALPSGHVVAELERKVLDGFIHLCRSSAESLVDERLRVSTIARIHAAGKCAARALAFADDAEALEGWQVKDAEVAVDMIARICAGWRVAAEESREIQEMVVKVVGEVLPVSVVTILRILFRPAAPPQDPRSRLSSSIRRGIVDPCLQWLKRQSFDLELVESRTLEDWRTWGERLTKELAVEQGW
ncbi:hypothetical protein HDU93_002144 [Gonapodya sp. JEL0774]|nr:hypothetical protein HDU93_002144 [Gonapodya sp. JEL0774]